MYKTKLQEMCDVKKWSYPKYSAIKVGPDHCPCFTASVFVNGGFFESPTACKSLKDAQIKAAESALAHFVSLSSARLQAGYVITKDDFKAEKTSKSTLPVEVGEVTKRDPEVKEKNSNSIAKLQEREIEAAKLDMKSLSLESLPQDSGRKFNRGMNSKSKKDARLDSAEVDGSSIKGKEKVINEKEDARAEKLVNVKEKDPEVRSFLLCNRFRVYSYIPDKADLPKG